jgi:phage portal protein BeeE
MRFASNEITAGYLQQTPNSEPMDGEELSDLVAGWSAARSRNAIAALNSSVTWHEFDSDPSKLQLVEARKHQMTELANLCNVPQVLVGADAGTGMTYTNVQESQRALYISAKQYIECISQTLSMNNVLAPGHLCRLNVSEYLHESPSMSSDDSSDATEATEIANVVQKIYLGVVNGLLTVDEARKIINEAGADLPESMPS